MDREFLLRKDSIDLDDELADEMYSNIGDSKSMFGGNMGVGDYQLAIDGYRRRVF